jgi:hypothetical protein
MAYCGCLAIRKVFPYWEMLGSQMCPEIFYKDWDLFRGFSRFLHTDTRKAFLKIVRSFPYQSQESKYGFSIFQVVLLLLLLLLLLTGLCVWDCLLLVRKKKYILLFLVRHVCSLRTSEEDREKSC